MPTAAMSSKLSQQLIESIVTVNPVLQEHYGPSQKHTKVLVKLTKEEVQALTANMLNTWRLKYMI